MTSASKSRRPPLIVGWRKNAQRLRAIWNNPMLLPLWLSWQTQILVGRDPVLRLFGFRFSGFYDFNAFVGAHHYRADAAELKYLTWSGRDAGVILDLGANMGVMSCLLHRAAPSAKVKAFEAHPRTADSLEANLRLNGIGNVTVHRTAAASVNGKVSFTDHGSPASNRIGSGPGSLEVPAIRLDDFAVLNGIERIDFLKIDVEGAEIDVLEGARSLFERRAVRAELIEINPGNLEVFGRTVDDMIDWLAELGYELRTLDANAEFGVGAPLPRGIVDPDFLSNAAFLEIGRQAAELAR